MNALLAIGCDRYSSLPSLQSAEKDARRVFACLSAAENQYDSVVSRLLLSPEDSEIMEALSAIFLSGVDLDTFTFFFAGHGVVKVGSFYLCTANTSVDRLSTTGFAITRIFDILNEFRPRQVNLIIDACQSGGSSYDLGNLAKPEVIGVASASSIAFLGACAADEFARETVDGGVLTNELLACLTGMLEIQEKTPFLDLVEVGSVISNRIQDTNSSQKPIVWGLSLFGRGKVAANPHYQDRQIDRAFKVPSIPPKSALGLHLQAFSAELWDEYRLAKVDPCPRRLLKLLAKILREAPSASGMVAVIQGLSHSMSIRARESTELFGAAQALAVCAVSLLPYLNDTEVREYSAALLESIVEENLIALKKVELDVEKTPRALISDVGVMGDLYYLPLRITSLLGWIGATIILNQLSRIEHPAETNFLIALASQLHSKYRQSLVAVSDAQAAPLYVFLSACLLLNETKLLENVAEDIFASFADRKGNVTRVDCGGEQAIQYIFSLGESEFRPKGWRSANPSLLLPAIIPFGHFSGCARNWDLQAFDRQTATFFLPDRWEDFGDALIERGCNHDIRIGFGAWTAREFTEQTDGEIARHLAGKGFSGATIALCVLASLLLPDRVPFVLSTLFPVPLSRTSNENT